MVHPDLGHVGKTYGYNGSSFTSSMIVNTPFIPHVRVKTVFLEAFKSYEDEEVLEGGGGHFIQASKGGGFEARIYWCLRLQKWKVRRARRSSGRRLF